MLELECWNVDRQRTAAEAVVVDLAVGNKPPSDPVESQNNARRRPAGAVPAVAVAVAVAEPEDETAN